ncbi:hypothetical protein ACFL1E_03000 [Candidatus Omnitrophota bacterium]
MKLKRFFCVLICVTLLSLVFVQVQVEILKLAYACKEEDNVLNKLLDDKNMLMYNIHTLESADNVGEFLICKKPELSFIERTQLVELRMPIRSEETFSLQAATANNRKPSFVARLFSLKSQAEATEKTK